MPQKNMVHKIRNFIRKHDNIVLLVCDYYNCKHIPKEIIDEKGNVCLFPVMNVPLIDYIVKSLISQSFKNIILCGKDIEAVYEYLHIHFKDQINLEKIEGENSLGDVLRYLNDINYELKDMLVMYGNQYSNFNFKYLFDKHKKNDNVITYYIHENKSNCKTKYLYGTKNQEIVFYNKIINDRIHSKNVKEAIEEYKTVEFNINGSSPNFAVISSEIFQLFTNNFDYNTLEDLLIGLLVFNPFNLKIGIIEKEDISVPDCKGYYNKEIITLLDYYIFNEEVRRHQELNKNINPNTPQFKIENTFMGEYNKTSLVNKDIIIEDSFIGHRCNINGNIKRCIIWDDINIVEDIEDYIMTSNKYKKNIFYLEDEIEEVEEEKPQSNFFDDIINYLNECATKDLKEIDLNQITKQINLIKIIWNASDADFVEAFAIFLIEFVKEDDIENQAIDASAFFPLLYGSINCKEDQEELLSIMYNLLSGYDKEYKAQVLFSYGFLFIQDGIITKSVLKKYNKMLKNDNF